MVCSSRDQTHLVIPLVFGFQLVSGSCLLPPLVYLFSANIFAGCSRAVFLLRTLRIMFLRHLLRSRTGRSPPLVGIGLGHERIQVRRTVITASTVSCRKNPGHLSSCAFFGQVARYSTRRKPWHDCQMDMEREQAIKRKRNVSCQASTQCLRTTKRWVG